MKEPLILIMSELDNLCNLKKEPIDTKEKMIKALVHTSNYEQIDVQSLWLFHEACAQYGIQKDKFYQDNRNFDKEGIEKYGCREWFYDDGEYSYTLEDYNESFKKNKK